MENWLGSSLNHIPGVPESFSRALEQGPLIKVYAEYIYIGKNLKHPRFEMVETAEEADVLWLTKSYKQFRDAIQRCREISLQGDKGTHILLIGR